MILLFFQFLLVIFGVILKLNSIYSLIINSASLGERFWLIIIPQLLVLIILLFIIYYSIVGYKKSVSFLKFGIYLTIIVMLITVPINLLANPIVSLIELIQLVLFIVFVSNLDNIKQSKLTMNILLVLSMVLVVIFAFDNTYSLEFAITPLIIIGTFALAYHTRYELGLK